jgi:predicted transposase YbfD/YdcC
LLVVGSEITTVQGLIAVLDIKGAVFSLDALHCQKTICKLIIDGGNGYAIAVKANQKNLHRQMSKWLFFHYLYSTIYI